mgnify:CR=1 FL=1
MGELSRLAAIAAECAATQGHFWDMHSALFTMVDSLGIRPWREFAKQVGIRDLEKFDSCMKAEEPQRVLDRDLAASQQLGIIGTPAVLVDSLLFTGSPGHHYLLRYIRLARRSNRKR